MTGTSRLRNDVGAALRRSLLLGVTITLGIFAVLAVPLALDSGLDAVRLQSTQSCARFASDTDAAGWTTRRIDPNRIEVSHENEPVEQLCLELVTASATPPRQLMISPDPDAGSLRVAIWTLVDGMWTMAGSHTLPATQRSTPQRFFVTFPNTSFGHTLRIEIRSGDEGRLLPSGKLVQELALLPSTSGGWRADFGRFLEDDSSTWLLLVLGVLGVVLFSLGSDRRDSLRLAIFALTLILSIGSTSARQRYPGAQNFRVTIQTLHLKSVNLTESLVMGSQFMSGNGLIGRPGVDTYRMPGHGLMAAAAGWIFRVSPSDMTSLTVSLVYFQLGFLALAMALFAWSFAGIVPTGVAALISVALCWFPHSFDYTQSDSVILPCGLLVTAALCRYLARNRRETNNDVMPHVLMHAAFALYLLVRTDVIVGWFLVSLILYRRRWRYLLIPIAFFLAIGLSWGLYKKLKGSDFVMTTSNFGHVAFVGLWEMPESYTKFVWRPVDESYDQWITAHGYKYAEPKTAGFAQREIFRFYLTYPGYVLGNCSYKLVQYFKASVWTGTLGLDPSIELGTLMRSGGAWVCVVLILTALVVGYERERTFLLAWSIFFSLPLFCLLQNSGGRFLHYVSGSLVIAAVPLLVDLAFYRRLYDRVGLTAIMAALGVVFGVYGERIATFLIRSDSIRYWAPLLDPSRSTLNIFR